MVEIVLITGCATGIGRALAENFSARRTENGARLFKVWATDYRLEGVKDLEELGMGAAQLDVTSVESINAAVAKILSEEGRIDLLVCNAGLSAPGYLTEMDYMDAQRLFNVNMHGVFRTLQPVAKSMMARRSGKIAVMGSVNSFFVNPFNAPYSGSKSAVATMTESLRMELEPFGVQVTTVCPAWVSSDIINNAIDSYDRYDRPESFFQVTIDVIRKVRKAGINSGCTTKQAANDICNGLAKSRPRRYLYTGTSLFYSLFWGFVQQWIPHTNFNNALIRRIKLPEAAKEAPMVWKGHFVKPPKEAPSEEAGKEEVPQNGKQGKEKPLPAELRKEE